MSKNKKTLLNETQVRQFMKLAMLQPLANGFINEMNCGDGEIGEPYEEGMYETYGRGTNELPTHKGRRRVMEEEEEMMDDDEDMDMADADEDPSLDDSDVELVDDEPEMDIDQMAAAEPEFDSGRTVSVDDFLQALETALESAMGDEVEIDAEDEVLEPEDEEDMDADADLDMDADADLDMDAEDADADLLESVTKRVAARILKAALKNK
jgi:hypothetical protein